MSKDKIKLGTGRTQFISFPRTERPPGFVTEIVEVFRCLESAVGTTTLKKTLKSDAVLALARPSLQKLGFQLELGKEKEQRIVRPVFFGLNGEPEKTYSVDAYHPQWRCGLEIEAGRAVGGNAIYRDLVQALVMVEVDYLVLAVPNAYTYGKKNTKTNDFKHTMGVANALFGHTRMSMPYKLTVIGY